MIKNDDVFEPATLSVQGNTTRFVVWHYIMQKPCTPLHSGLRSTLPMVFPPLIYFVPAPYHTTHHRIHEKTAIMLSYPSTAPSQPTNSVSQSLNTKLMSRELNNDLRCLRFTLRLPLVESDKTLPNEAECIICKEPYGESFQIKGPEVACQLPCKCIVGHLCAWRHFAPFQGAHVTCPVCHVQFSELANVDKSLFTPTTHSSRQKHEEEAIKQLEQPENAA